MVTERAIMAADMKGGSQLDPDRTVSLEQMILHMECVLPMQQMQSLFEDELIHLVGPDGQSCFQAKLAKRGHKLLIDLACCRFDAAHDQGIAIGKLQFFANRIEH